MLDPKQMDTLTEFYQSAGQITVLTGAGISAESGIPTFRGKEGYWQIGSKNYQPHEIATYRMFSRQPREVWKWYLFRRGVCRQAEPNAGHLALVQMERLFQNRFLLITQNVDGLHLRAGNSLDRTYPIHGDIEFMRCADECSSALYPIPDAVPGIPRNGDLTSEQWALLTCPRCGAMTRPHILWFDEYYNEEFYHFESSLQVATKTDLLLVVGTSGATNLPNQVVQRVYHRGGIIIDVNIEPNVFSRLALATPKGFFLHAPSSEVLPQIVECFQQVC